MRLTGRDAYDLLQKLVYVLLPSQNGFSGVTSRAFDRAGNLHFRCVCCGGCCGVLWGKVGRRQQGQQCVCMCARAKTYGTHTAVAAHCLSCHLLAAALCCGRN